VEEKIVDHSSSNSRASSSEGVRGIFGFTILFVLIVEVDVARGIELDGIVVE